MDRLKVRVRPEQNLLVDQTRHGPGDEVELPLKRAERMISLGVVEPVEREIIIRPGLPIIVDGARRERGQPVAVRTLRAIRLIMGQKAEHEPRGLPEALIGLPADPGPAGPDDEEAGP